MDIQKYWDNYYKGSKDQTLDSIKYLIDCYDNFEEKMKFIHIAGTNGKGSCVEIINNILIKQGYKVGKFLSPHLIKFNERISINGKDITDEELAYIFEELSPKIEEYNSKHEIKISRFELITISALLYFYRNKVDFVVLETGLGGLHDSTNIITKPLVSIITSIGYDHMHILGNTLPEIAKQKAGIIKQNSNTIINKQEPEVDNVFIETCKKMNNNLTIVNEEDITNYSYDDNYQYFDYKDIKNIKINLKGIKQVNNSCIAIECMKILKQFGCVISENKLKEGLSTVIHKARFETINKKPLIIYDGAHNEPAIKNFQKSMDMYYKNKKRKYIIAVLKRKDYKTMLSLLLKDEKATFIFTSGNNETDYRTKEELYEYAKQLKKEKQTIETKTLNQAIEDTMKSNNEDVTLILGTFHIYSSVIEQIKEMNQ